LKDAALEAVERQCGNAEHHEALMQTLRKIAEHAKARYALQAKTRADAIAEAARDAEEILEDTLEETPDPTLAPSLEPYVVSLSK
jgi:uncharacterized protein HemY